MTLEQPALSRAALDRAAHRREEPDLMARLLGVASTRILDLYADRATVADTPEGTRLVLSTAGGDPSGQDAGVLLAYLGEDRQGRAHLLRARAGAQPGTEQGSGEDAGSDATVADGVRLAGLREVGALLDDLGAGLLTTSVALANWHTGHPRCARCGQATVAANAGWTRHCPACGADHFPRTDPAVIMSVVDEAGRILLGRQRVWPERRFSTLAGFVEPGESLEAAVRREVMEEAGIRVDAVSYLGSQPWPFPGSLMLAFQARATSTRIHVDGTELQEARWWTREEFGLDVATGELLLPPGVSIARRIIERWYGSPIHSASEGWR